MSPWSAATSRCDPTALFPGCGAARSDAPLIRDRRRLSSELVTIPGQQRITSCCAAPGKRAELAQRHIGENFILLRFRLGLVFLVEILDRAFAEISQRQPHHADAARPPGGGLGA